MAGYCQNKTNSYFINFIRFEKLLVIVHIIFKTKYVPKLTYYL